MPAPGFRGHVATFDLVKHSEISHVNMEKNAEIQDQVMNKILDLADTPAKAAFNNAQRSVSHGCVRLEKAIDLAKLLLGREGTWTPERLDTTLAGDQTISVPLKQSIPVRIFYWTAFVEGDQVSFRDDIYAEYKANRTAMPDLCRVESWMPSKCSSNTNSGLTTRTGPNDWSRLCLTNESTSKISSSLRPE